MNAHNKTISRLAAVSIFTVAGCVMADDKSDALRAAPPAVQSAVIQLVGGNKVGDFDTETEGGKTVYEVEYDIKGTTYGADISPAGEILEREVEVDLSIIPPAVVDAAKKAHTDGKIGESSIVTSGDKMFYEMDVKVGKDEREMQISAGGAVLADAIEAPEAGEGPEQADKPGEKAGEKEDKD